jgi:hypothetical protein
VQMSAYDPKRTSQVAPHMSALGGKADMAHCSAKCPLLTQSGHVVCGTVSRQIVHSNERTACKTSALRYVTLYHSALCPAAAGPPVPPSPGRCALVSYIFAGSRQASEGGLMPRDGAIIFGNLIGKLHVLLVAWRSCMLVEPRTRVAMAKSRKKFWLNSRLPKRAI